MGIWNQWLRGGVAVVPPEPLPSVSDRPVDRQLLDEVCGWVRGGSQVDPQALAAMTLMAEDARLMAEAFDGEDGRKRLMILARMTVLRPPVDVNRPAADREVYSALRQGQDSIFAAVVRYLDIHRAQQRKDHDGPSSTGTGSPDARASGNAADERFTDPYDPDGTIGGR